MQNSTRRLLVSAALSMLGLATTIAWYKNAQKNSIVRKDEVPVAKLLELENEVQRKFARRLIWQDLANNDILFTGEAVRTSKNSRAVIWLPDINNGNIDWEKGLSIDLEPESVIVLERNRNKLALNFLEGDLTVRQNGTTSSNSVVLQTESGTVELKNSELNLERGKNGPLSMQVLKGQAEITLHDGKKIQVDQNNSALIQDGRLQKTTQPMEVLAPKPNQALWTNPKIQQPITFQWKPIDRRYQVSIEVGDSGKNLHKINGVPVSGDKGTLTAKLKPGMFYWRLLATSDIQELPALESIRMKNRILLETPPRLVSPENNSEVTLLGKENLSLRWSNPMRVDRLILEIAKQKSFSDRQLYYPEIHQDHFEIQPEADGTYYWRISGFINETNKIISSPIAEFRMHRSMRLEPPQQVHPILGQEIFVEAMRIHGIEFQWRSTGREKKFALSIEKMEGEIAKEIVKKELILNSYLWKGEIPPGTYRWKVTSTDEANKESLPSPTREFSILHLPTIEWLNKNLTQSYATPKPEISLEWKSPSGAVAKYNIQIQGKSEKSELIEHVVTATLFRGPVPVDDDYVINIEGLDTNGKLVARSTPLEVKVKLLPLLSAPTFAQDLPTELLATPAGDIHVRWDKKAESSSTWLTISNSKGEELKSIASPDSAYWIKDLLPGEYKCTLQSVDQWNRRGPASVEKIIRVPETSGIAAPAKKSIQFEVK